MVEQIALRQVLVRHSAFFAHLRICFCLPIHSLRIFLAQLNIGIWLDLWIYLEKNLEVRAPLVAILTSEKQEDNIFAERNFWVPEYSIRILKVILALDNLPNSTPSPDKISSLNWKRNCAHTLWQFHSIPFKELGFDRKELSEHVSLNDNRIPRSLHTCVTILKPCKCIYEKF